MTRKKPSVDDVTDLRRQAERALQQQLPEETELSGVAVQELVHELRVHQIELEMQNDELRRTQVQLEASRDRYAGLYDFAPIGYFTISEQGLIVEANLTGANLLGLARGDLLERPFSRFIARSSQDKYYLIRRQIFTIGMRVQSFELSMVTEEAVLFEAHLTCTAVLDEEGVGDGRFRIAVTDITKRVQAEAKLQESNSQLEATLIELKAAQGQMIQQERLAAVGQLAAGIAHDFNNILTSILIFAELIERSPHTLASEKPKALYIIEAGERAAHLVQQILAFSRKAILHSQQINLVSFIHENIKFFERIIPENILVSVEVAPGDYLIQGDPTQLQQVLTNLVINASHAMPQGGQLAIRLAHQSGRPSDSLFCEDLETVAHEWVVLSLSDTGTGISAEVLPHIFEPFFTTKETGKGSGLGLAQVYGLVRQHKGCLDVSSQMGQGTTFTIYLPSAAVQEPPAPIDVPPEVVRHGAGETILLVEDEPIVLQAVQAVLLHLNYQVLTATNGEEALAVYAQHKDEIGLVLSDVIMPKMDGTVLLEKLKAQNPMIPVIMMTGYVQDEPMPEVLVDGIVPWLYKPINIQQLAQVVDEVLHQ